MKNFEAGLEPKTKGVTPRFPNAASIWGGVPCIEFVLLEV